MKPQKKNKAVSQPNPEIPRWKHYVTVLFLAVITVAVYYNSMENEFTNWDDNFYVTENNDIKTLHGDSAGFTIKKAFTTYVTGNYHPLTMLTFCVEYQLAQLDPRLYHATNIALHLLNAILVYIFCWLLCRKWLVAFITSFFFAIHPMHAESVAWISERKDVLYSFFYLLGLCSWLLYINSKERKWLYYALAFFLFVLALLSKAVAVTLPIAFFLLDYFTGRKITAKIFAEKIPFILLACIFGYVAVLAQGTAVNRADVFSQYSFYERILFTCYAVVYYLWKFLWPVDLTAFYAYPIKPYPLIIQIAPLLLLLAAAAVFLAGRKNKIVLFGLGFFFVTSILVLQILPVGAAMVADRYTYLPYIGLFFILSYGLDYFLLRKKETPAIFKPAAGVLIAVCGFLCCVATYNRCKIWHDSLSLWDSVILESEKRHVFSRDVYLLRAPAYQDRARYEEAIRDYTLAIGMDSTFAPAYFLRGNCYYALGKYVEAVNDYSSHLALKPDNPEGWYNRGTCYAFLKRYEEAMLDFTHAIQYNPNYAEAYNNRGFILNTYGKFPEAIADYSLALKIKPGYADAWAGLAMAYLNNKNFEMAISAYTRFFQLKPGAGADYNNRAFAYFNLHKYDLALADLNMAKQYGYPVAPQFVDALQNAMKPGGK